MSRKLRKFLIVKADGSMRIVGRTPDLALDEFAYVIAVEIPDAWSRIVGQIDLALPDPADLPAVQVRLQQFDLPKVTTTNDAPS